MPPLIAQASVSVCLPMHRLLNPRTDDLAFEKEDYSSDSWTEVEFGNHVTLHFDDIDDELVVGTRNQITNMSVLKHKIGEMMKCLKDSDKADTL